MSEHIRELSTQELDSVTGGWAMSWVALNPQPIPPRAFCIRPDALAPSFFRPIRVSPTFFPTRQCELAGRTPILGHRTMVILNQKLDEPRHTAI